MKRLSDIKIYLFLLATCLLRHQSHSFHINTSSPLRPVKLHSLYKQGSNSFYSSYRYSKSTTSTKTLSSSNDDDSSTSPDDTNPSRPDLIKLNTFISAVETIHELIAKSNNVEYVKEDDPNVGYAIGRVLIPLAIPPGIDLIETPQLVLVNGINQAAKDAGVEPLDSVVGVSVVGGGGNGGEIFKAKTKGMNIDDTFTTIKAAISKARENDCTEIEFEFNRLIKGYYK